jgi:hypothetical protein
MFVRLIQATAITLALYGLLGLNTLQTNTAKSSATLEAVVEPGEVLVALKQALNRE